MAREDARTKAGRLLLEGRVSVTSMRNGNVTAVVRGEGHHYDAGYRNGIWHCTCEARSDQCSHLHAIRRVVSVGLEDHR